MRAAWIALALLVTLAGACGVSSRDGAAPPPSPAAAPTDPEVECERHLLCNAPVCSCPEGTRCERRCTEPRPGCTECVRR